MQLEGLLDTLQDAKEYGSILKVESYNWELLRRYVSAADAGEQITMNSAGLEVTVEQLLSLIDIAETMAQKYDVVVTNPPYMGGGNMDARLSEFVKKHYPDSKSDLFAVFIERCGQMTSKNRYQSMITQHSWMFLSSFEKLREKLLQKDTINMAHLGPRAFEEIGGEVVQTTSFVLRKSHVADYKGTYCRLIDPTTQQGKEDMFLAGIHRYATQQSNFSKIPGSPVAYWISNRLFEAFSDKLLSDFAQTKQGFATGDNDRFLRFWHEVSDVNTAFLCKKGANLKWFPCNKGGSYRKWYGNNTYLANWYNDGSEMRGFSGSVIRNPQFYFREGITWSSLANQLSLRFSPAGFIFESKGSMCFVNERKNLWYILGLLNSKVTAVALSVLSPTLDFHEGPMLKVPVEKPLLTEQVDRFVENSVEISKDDWDSFEISWDFQHHPLIRSVSTVADAFAQWEDECNERFNQLKANEEELNRIFIDIYGLQDELTPEVEDKDVTVRKADLQREIKSLLSYAVGCMFGRYSLDTEGLAYAGGDWDESKYKTFLPDADGILPITDEEYLGDDIVTRLCSWLSVVYGKETLEDNLDYIAKALGSKGDSSREIIRSYFLKDFFKDHCKIYQKRPIYWLFDSGKQNGFKALVYMHRWNADTTGNVRVEYLHRVQRVYESEIARMRDTIDNSSNAREVSAAQKRCHQTEGKAPETAQRVS